jgi:hypothetical protein
MKQLSPDFEKQFNQRFADAWKVGFKPANERRMQRDMAAAREEREVIPAARRWVKAFRTLLRLADKAK